MQGDSSAPAEDSASYQLLDLAYDAIFQRDFGTDRIHLWNRGAERLYGWTAAQAIGRVSHELLQTIVSQPLQDIKAELAATGRWEGELIHTRRDGSKVVVASRWATRAEGDVPADILEINTSVTDRVRASEYAARLAAIIRSSNDAIIGKTLDGIITSWNPAAEALYGYSEQEVIGQPIAILVPPDLLEELRGIMEKLRRGERIEDHATQRVRKDGKRLDVSISISPVLGDDGRILGAATIARNIGDRVRIEQERAQMLKMERSARREAEAARERLTFLAEASALLSSSLDYETTLQTVSHLAVPYIADWCSVHIIDDQGSARRLSVVHRDPSRLETLQMLEERYPPDPEDPNGSYNVIRTGEPVIYPEISDDLLARGARDDDHLQLMRDLQLRSIMTVPLKARGHVVGLLSLANSESGRTFTDSDLHLANELAHRGGQAVDNAQLYHDAQRALQLRDEFLSIASHELKTPLTALQLQTQLLVRATRTGSGTDLDSVVGSMGRQIKRLTRLTNDLLDVARITTGQFQLDRSEFDLSILVQEVADRFQEELQAADCEIELRATPVFGRWDRHRLDQAITNLLSNAIKYGGGRPIDISVGPRSHDAYVSVRDRGVGIATEHIDTIFDRFTRIETVERTAGLGLGLFIVRQIMDAHGGTVRVVSERGEGSAFTIELPR